MRIYRFVIRALPSASNAYRNQLQNGIAHIYVFAADSASAEAEAHAYMVKHDWIPTGVEHAFEIQPQQSLDLDKHEALLYQRAQQHGIAADIVAVSFRAVLLALHHLVISHSDLPNTVSCRWRCPFQFGVPQAVQGIGNIHRSFPLPHPNGA